jgi:hypothetical protein
MSVSAAEEKKKFPLGFKAKETKRRFVKMGDFLLSAKIVDSELENKF